LLVRIQEVQYSLRLMTAERDTAGASLCPVES